MLTASWRLMLPTSVSATKNWWNFAYSGLFFNRVRGTSKCHPNSSGYQAKGRGGSAITPSTEISRRWGTKAFLTVSRISTAWLREWIQNSVSHYCIERIVVLISSSDCRLSTHLRVPVIRKVVGKVTLRCSQKTGHSSSDMIFCAL